MAQAFNFLFKAYYYEFKREDPGTNHKATFKTKIEALMFGPLLQIIVCGFVPITVAVYLELGEPLFTTWGEWFGFILAVMFFILNYICLPVVLVYTVYVPKEKLLEPVFKRQFGWLWGNVKTENRWQRSFRILFVWRRFMILWVAFRWYETPTFQLMILTFVNYAMLFYAAYA